MLGVTKAACFPCTFEERFNIFENTPPGFFDQWEDAIQSAEYVW